MKPDIRIKCMHSIQWSLKLSHVNKNLSGLTLFCKLLKSILHHKKFILQFFHEYEQRDKQTELRNRFYKGLQKLLVLSFKAVSIQYHNL